MNRVQLLKGLAGSAAIPFIGPAIAEDPILYNKSGWYCTYQDLEGDIKHVSELSYSPLTVESVREMSRNLPYIMERFKFGSVRFVFSAKYWKDYDTPVWFRAIILKAGTTSEEMFSELKSALRYHTDMFKGV